MVTLSARVLPYRSSLRKGKHHGFKTKKEIHWIKFQGTCTMTTKVYSILNSCFVTNSRIFFLCLKSLLRQSESLTVCLAPSSAPAAG